MSMDENELILAMHNLLEQVEKSRRVAPAAAYVALEEALQTAGEERGVFEAEDD